MARNTKTIKQALNIVDAQDMVLPEPTKPSRQAPSAFVKETKKMAAERREKEKNGHRYLGISVVDVAHSLDERALSEEQSLDIQTGMQSNPLLDNQRFDGFDPNTSPEPAMNTAARKEFDEVKQQQQEELKMRLGLSPKPGPQYTPKNSIKY